MTNLRFCTLRRFKYLNYRVINTNDYDSFSMKAYSDQVERKIVTVTLNKFKLITRCLYVSSIITKYSLKISKPRFKNSELMMPLLNIVLKRKGSNKNFFYIFHENITYYGCKFNFFFKMKIYRIWQHHFCCLILYIECNKRFGPKICLLKVMTTEKNLCYKKKKMFKLL